LEKNAVPDWADWGTYDRTLSLDPSIYMHWLQSSCLDAGVRFQRATLSHIREAFQTTSPRPAVVVNCTGLQALKLGGVND
jgi:D-amino-acid oxidase